jgi:hypothetical protein
MSEAKFKIRNSYGQYSKGVVMGGWDRQFEHKTFYINWGKKGKEWTSEKTLKTHLLKCAQCGILDSTWEILEVKYHPTKPVNDWIDQKMLLKILKNA